MTFAFWMVGVVIVGGGLIVLLWTPALVTRWRYRRAPDLRVQMTTKRVAELHDREVH